VREAPTPYGSSYGAVYFELILETALVLVLGTGEGAVLTGTLAYGLRSSLDSYSLTTYASAERSPESLLSSGGGSPSPLGTTRRLLDDGG
jgi:hypothetical protein